eukprot:gnl/TRDRNA2_/TRDRNA2_179338_c0_seq1.p1 gnl/TRDRNA2_/TRDRNA2_179338_c0~~gnl/TRDRNA2_/TRDRNA2_179338_c0_seq1.p1  ORF type:complete len:551 (+),score=57.66 gnl/TRDRNA2_/TRDRNA2_179338_c0_seq1:81-1655(+)
MAADPSRMPPWPQYSTTPIHAQEVTRSTSSPRPQFTTTPMQPQEFSETPPRSVSPGPTASRSLLYQEFSSTSQMQEPQPWQAPVIRTGVPPPTPAENASPQSSMFFATRVPESEQAADVRLRVSRSSSRSPSPRTSSQRMASGEEAFPPEDPYPDGVRPQYVWHAPVAQKKGFDTVNKLGWAIIGMFVLLMLILNPVWNALALLQDEMYVYVQGKTTPFLMIGSCAFVYVAYALILIFFFRYGRRETQTEKTLLIICNLLITLLGVVLLVLSVPPRMDAGEARRDILKHCASSDATRDLYTKYVELASLRGDDKCIHRSSVEDCDGFNSTREADVLKYMEMNLHCSGFCSSARGYDSNVTQAKMMAGTTTTTVAPILLQRGKAIQLPSHLPNASAKNVPGDLTDSDAITYPPTLFTKRNFRSSCEGMAARHFDNFVEEVSQMVFWEGICLVSVALGMAFLGVLGLCVKTMRVAPPLSYGIGPSNKALAAYNVNPYNYGATDADPPPMRRYVSAGILRNEPPPAY